MILIMPVGLPGDVASVYAKKITAVHPDAPVDYGLVILTHRSGTISHITGSWAYPPPTFRTHLEIAGDGGLIEFDSADTSPILNLIAKTNSDSPDVGLPSSPVSESPYTTQIKEFYAVLAGRKSNPESQRKTVWRQCRLLKLPFNQLSPVRLSNLIPALGGAVMKIGIMSFAHHHAEAYIANLRAIPGVEVCGVADEDPKRGQQFAQLHGASFYPTYEALLESKPDGVIICSENSKHLPLVEMAAAAKR